MSVSIEQLELYQTLFHGRTDIYARRWEKNGKSGWSPAYSFDWNEFNAHRTTGGTIKNFDNKSLLPLTTSVLKKHLYGSETVGVYPIFTENTSYFIASDFDKKSWKIDVEAFNTVCGNYDLHTYTEISQSGNGAHVWVFFKEAYPCFKSRAIMLNLIQKTFPFHQTSSFDRLFPNQDTLPVNGFGNLIALPLQGQRANHGCSVFLNGKTNTPYEDQWMFLADIKKQTSQELDCLYNELLNLGGKNKKTKHIKQDSGSICIQQNGSITLSRNQLPPQVIEFIKEKLNIFNKEYGIKKHLGKSIFGIERYFHMIEEDGEHIILPRGFTHTLINFLIEEGISYSVEETKKDVGHTSFKSHITLRTEQESIVEQTLQNKNGIIVAPPGSGKTVVALETIARLKLPTLILVHRNQLLQQWIVRTEQFLSIPKSKIGVISGTKKKVGDITIATIQSLVRYKKLSEIIDHFRVIIIDECHHIPAKTYRDLIAQFSSMYCYGLTATHERKYGSEILTELCIGPVIVQMTETTANSEKTFDINILSSKLTLPFRYTNDHYEILAKTICYDSRRNELITKSILKHAKKKLKILVLTERKEHIDVLSLHLRDSTELLTLTGADSARQQKLKHAQIESGNFNVILSTGQLIGEGVDIDGFDVLVLAFPLAFEGKLKQYIGRLRGSGAKYIIDIHDEKITFLDRQFKKRNKFYKNLSS